MKREHPTAFGTPAYWLGTRLALALFGIGAWLTAGEPHDLEDDDE